MERMVTVWGKQVPVAVHQVSKSVWLAAGDYLGSHIEVKDRSERSALARWREAATYRGN
jgi:hypothetical protein